MRRQVIAVNGNLYDAADHNAFQDRGDGTNAGSLNADFVVATACIGQDTVVWQSGAAGLATATLVEIDGQIDWRDRIVRAEFVNLTAANKLPGGAADYIDWGFDGAYVQSRYLGYTGIGAYDAAHNAPTNGNKPTPGAGPPASYCVTMANKLYLYVDPVTFRLCIYNDTGGTLHFVVVVSGTGKTGKH